MKRLLLWSAVVWIAAANGFVLFHAWQNRSASPQPFVELTERQLQLEGRGEDESAIFLRFVFDGSASRGARGREKAPGWLDTGKLRELGYDIDPAATQKPAESRLVAMPAKEVFVVLDAAPPQPSDSGSATQAEPAHLSAIDAGLNPASLRDKYPDARRYIIARAIVSPWLESRYDERRRTWETGKLRGVIDQLAVPRIHVPAPQNKSFARFGNSPSRTYLFPQGEPERPSRYKVSLAYGRHYEPWVVAVDLLSGR